MRPRLLVLLVVVVGLIPGTVTASAAEPPNQHDPCSSAGRDSCKTTGVGRYDTYRYGVRWFGDYRGAIPGLSGPAWCIDLRFWYPGAKYGYEKRPVGTLENKDGDSVSESKLHRMSYALWAFGRSEQKARQAAVMLYVHQLMGDGAPGEVDPKAIGADVATQFSTLSAAAERFAGPYRIETKISGPLKVGRPAKATIRVLAASGAALPDVTLDVTSRGASGARSSVTTSHGGAGQLHFTPTDPEDGLRIAVKSEELAADEPTLYVPTRGAAARSGQRLVAAKSATVSATDTADVAAAVVGVKTKATPDVVTAGGEARDAVTISGVVKGWTGEVELRVYGPARTRETLACTATPLTTATFRARRGMTQSPAFTLARPGWYAYQLVVPGSAGLTGLTTPCPEAGEIVKVEAQPVVHTQVSAASLAPGGSLRDTVSVSGLGGEPVAVVASLYGPYPAADKITCDGAPAWTGTFTADKDGDYLTDPVPLTVPGYYTYRESVAATGLTRAAEHPCGEAPQTTIVPGKPAILTQVSAQEAAVGAQIHDTAVVSGLGGLAATVNVELWGPFARRSDIACTGTPHATGTFAAAGDGSYDTAPVTLTKAGYYTYRESIAASAANEAVTTRCGEGAETTIARAKPAVVTTVSDSVVQPGSSIFDTIKVTGLGQTAATIQVELHGPFASRDALRCSGTPFWKGSVKADGDGTVRSPAVKLNRAGFYTYVERIAGSDTVTAAATECGQEAETSLTAPLILTGRGEGAVVHATPAAEKTIRPTQIRLTRLGVDAPVAITDIDTGSGALAIPKNIDRAGWWRDGAAPGDTEGTILIAGHVDSAARGAGAFYPLKSARAGDIVELASDDGKTRRFRVTTIKTVRKTDLPQGIFTRGGARRLVLVTCGGPFNEALGHYRDNIVVTAVPA